MDRYKQVTLGIDIMKVNKLPFLVSISRALKFGTVELVANQKMPTVLGAVKHIHALYTKRGFKIKFVLADGEFESLRSTVPRKILRENGDQ